MNAPRATSSVTVKPAGPPELAFEPFVPWYVLLALAAAVVLTAARSYARSTRPLPLGRRVTLWILRAAACLAVLLCLSRPMMVWTKTLRERGTCFIALDASSSMNLRDAPEGRSRWAFAGGLFARQQKALAALAERFEIRRLLFDSRPRETARLPGEDAKAPSARPEGRATDLSALLERFRAEAGGTLGACALLISDGRHNTPDDPVPLAALLHERGLPLYIIGVGQESTPPDYRELQVKLVQVPERAFVGSQVTIRIEVQSHLPEAASVPLNVTVNGKPLPAQTLALPAGPGLRSVEMPYTPRVLGVHRVSASVPAQPKELNTNNNVRSAYFRVFRSRLGIWYVEGAIRKEFGALRSALETAPNIRMHALNAFLSRPGTDEALLPESKKEWKNLRLIILGDLPAKRFSAKQCRRMERFVEEGGALLMIGGIQNFGIGGWHRTALAKALPVKMGWSDGSIEGPLRMRLTPEGEQHPAARLADDARVSRKLWEKLPPLPGINALSGIKPAAQVLVRANDQPLLIVQEFGKGRSAAFTGDMTWQWILKAGQGAAHRHFWRSLVTWLTRSTYRDANQVVFIETDRLQYLLGGRVQLTAHVQETAATRGRIENARVVATLALENGPKKEWVIGRGSGAFRARNTPTRPGHYTCRVDVQDASGKVLGHDELSFQVEVLDVENDNPKANLRLLQRLAALSGGVYYDTAHAAQAFREILQRPAGFSKTVRQSSELWNHWSLFALFVALLGLEWILRKRWGLV